ncbi:MAG: asparagine synthase C-terminal domain-containing protein, partial [Deltaproteobacteria bacterium]|nr:asparagine synthase C-terminal domain-containing protein [Deltaproteobacteria bacterium]
QIVYDLLPRSVREKIIEPVVDRLPSTTDYYGTSFIKKLKLFALASVRMRENPDAVIPRTFSHREVVRLTGMEYKPDADPILSLARQYWGLDPVTRMMFTDMQTYMAEDILTKVDRMSMAHSLEVRCPLLDFRVVEAACRMPRSFKIHGRGTKRILRYVARGHVPEPIIKRSKYGFQVPLGEWFRHELREWAQERLLDYSHPHVQRQSVENLWNEHQRGRHDHTHKLWSILFFNEWCRQFG